MAKDIREASSPKLHFLASITRWKGILTQNEHNWYNSYQQIDENSNLHDIPMDKLSINLVYSAPALGKCTPLCGSNAMLTELIAYKIEMKSRAGTNPERGDGGPSPLGTPPSSPSSRSPFSLSLFPFFSFASLILITYFLLCWPYFFPLLFSRFLR